MSQFTIPDSWAVSEFDHIGEVVTGNTPPKKDPENYGEFIPFVKPPELTDKPISSATDSLSEVGASKGRVLPPNSALVSCIGILGKTGINVVPVAINQQINAIIPHRGISGKYLFYYAQTIGQWLQSVSSATTIPIVNKSKFSSTLIPIAPEKEQLRIVQRIDALNSQLDVGIESLNKAKLQLKRYRQSVLKSAMEGKLTAKWREKNKDKLEPASELLNRILKERREKWGDDQLAKMTAKGKPPKNDDWKKKYKEPQAPDTTNLPDLPEGWEWVKLSSIMSLFSGFAFKSKEYVRHGIPILRMGNIKRDYSLSLGGKKQPFLPSSRLNEFSAFLLTEGDLVITLTDLSTTGRFLGTVARLNRHEQALLNQRVSKIVLPESVDRNFIFYMLQQPRFRQYMVMDKTGSLQKNTNHRYVLDCLLPLPPHFEQVQIVQILEQIDSKFISLSEVMKLVVSCSSGLRNAVFSNAFAGRLVSQNPDDEPASILLERIRKQ